MVKEGIQIAMQVWITIEERVKEMVIDLIKSSKWFERETWDKVVRIEAK